MQETKVSDAGRVSVTLTEDAGLPPALPTAIVYVMLEPVSTGSGDALTLTLRSANAIARYWSKLISASDMGVWCAPSAKSFESRKL